MSDGPAVGGDNEQVAESAPTVIVARRPRVGRESEFQAWNDRLREAARQFRGFLGSEAQPPDAAHPDEWMILYRFDSQSNLDRWLGSEERAALMALGEELMEGPAREQRVARPRPTDETVTAVMSQRLRPDAIEEFHRAEVEIALTMSRFPGFISVEHAEPVPGVQDDHVILITFASRADLDRWLHSRERQEVVGLVEPWIEGERTVSVVGGFGGWFSPGEDVGPPRWKQAVAVLIALYPTTLTLGWLQQRLLPDVPWVPALFVSNVVGIALLTWLLMPFVTRLLDPWLRR